MLLPLAHKQEPRLCNGHTLEEEEEEETLVEDEVEEEKKEVEEEEDDERSHPLSLTWSIELHQNILVLVHNNLVKVGRSEIHHRTRSGLDTPTSTCTHVHTHTQTVVHLLKHTFSISYRTTHYPYHFYSRNTKLDDSLTSLLIDEIDDVICCPSTIVARYQRKKPQQLPHDQ